jgi:hypothetical protein
MSVHTNSWTGVEDVVRVVAAETRIDERGEPRPAAVDRLAPQQLEQLGGDRAFSRPVKEFDVRELTHQIKPFAVRNASAVSPM